MHKLLYLLIIPILLFAACDGAEEDLLADDYCYLVINTIDIQNAEDGAECTITFLFTDEEGNEYSASKYVPQDASTSTIIALPKNKCYDAWVTDWGYGGSCGDYTFQIESPSGPCYVFSENLQDHGEIPSDLPEFSFCLDDECNCPEVTEN